MKKPNAGRSKNPLVRLLANKRFQFIIIPLFSILCSLLAISIIVLLIGKSPLAVFSSILQGAGLLPRANYAKFQNIFTTFMETLNAMTPMLFAALAVAVASKAGLFNIGVSGQMLIAGFTATVLVGYSSLPRAVAMPLVIIIGIVVGALAGGLIGLLKYRFNINEVVSSIMLNYIFQYTISYFINVYYADPVTRQSKNVAETARLTLINVEVGDLKINIALCFVLALFAAWALYVFVFKTRKGYEIKAVGLNPKAAEYAGMRVGGTIVLAMIISGALSGLAGVTYYLGYYSSIRPNVLASMGFDSIAVALLGNAHPIGIIFSSFLITTLDRGSTYMSSNVGVQQEVASLVTGMILLFSACGAYIRDWADRKNRAAGAKEKSRV
ncbi:ABC transporter permease [Christensenellaceae bacterium OttesenSCG-928-L17]|nr:ABC transporter permease [Christensenellaceae bacterium OttesenSCG-928-L17]